MAPLVWYLFPCCDARKHVGHVNIKYVHQVLTIHPGLAQQTFHRDWTFTVIFSCIVIIVRCLSIGFIAVSWMLFWGFLSDPPRGIADAMRPDYELLKRNCTHFSDDFCRRCANSGPRALLAHFV